MIGRNTLATRAFTSTSFPPTCFPSLLNEGETKITEVKLIVSGSSTSNARTSLTSISGAKLLENVEKSYDEGVKLLEASEKSSRTMFSAFPGSLGEESPLLKVDRFKATFEGMGISVKEDPEVPFVMWSYSEDCLR